MPPRPPNIGRFDDPSRPAQVAPEDQPVQPEGDVSGILTEEQDTAREFTDEFRDRAFGFNGEEAVRESATGAFDFLRTDIEEQVEDLRGSQVGRGRLSTGFGFEDEDRLVRNIFDRFSSQLVANSLQAAQLDLQNNRQLGDFANLSRNRFLDFLSGERDRSTARQNSEDSFIDILGSGLELAGTVVPFL